MREQPDGRDDAELERHARNLFKADVDELDLALLRVLAVDARQSGMLILARTDSRAVVSLDEAVDTVIVRTRQFAVRQERWFRRDPRVRWVHIEHDPVAEVLPVLESLA